MTQTPDGQARRPRNGTTGEPTSSISGAAPKHREQTRELERAASKQWSSRADAGSRPFSTGLLDLDEAIGGGFCRGEMVILGARPSHGKTALILQLLAGISRTQPCLLFNSEMSETMLGQRLNTAIMCGMPMSDWPAERPDEWYTYFAVRRSCISWTGVRDVRRLVHIMRAGIANDYGAKKPPRVVGVDYLQLLKGEGKTRYEQITDVSIQLRVAASELNTAVVVCAQLSREVARPMKDGTTSVRMPVLSDLRDSGQIEQDADVVLLLQWPWKEDPSKPQHEFKISVAKNRNRAIVRPQIMIAFDAASQTFMSLRDWSYRNQVDDHQADR